MTDEEKEAKRKALEEKLALFETRKDIQLTKDANKRVNEEIARIKRELTELDRTGWD